MRLHSPGIIIDSRSTVSGGRAARGDLSYLIARGARGATSDVLLFAGASRSPGVNTQQSVRTGHWTLLILVFFFSISYSFVVRYTFGFLWCTPGWDRLYTAFPTPPSSDNSRKAQSEPKKDRLQKNPSRHRRWNRLEPVPAPLTLHYTH